MVKKISVNVTYNNQKKIISCQQHEFPEKVAEHFKITVNDVVMFSIVKGLKHPIKPSEIKDLMTIEMVSRKVNQRSIRILENDTPNKLLESIMNKLRQNSQLTGQERRVMLEGLETHSLSFFKKRKLNERDDKPETSVAHKKVQVNISAKNVKDSFAQTDPINIPEVTQNSEDVTEKLKKIASNPAKKQEIALLMKTSFPDRRKYIIMNIPPVTIVKEMYPALFSLDEVKRELDRIFYPGKCKEFVKNIEKFAQIILDYLPHGDEILDKTDAIKSAAQTPVQKTYAVMVGSVFGLAKLVEEQFGFIHLSDYPHGSADVYPYIDASCNSLKEIFYDNVLFPIIVEGQHLCEASNFPEAILCLIASFFIFNINYPDRCRRTLTVIEKLFLTANDTTDMDELTIQMIKLFELKAK